MLDQTESWHQTNGGRRLANTLRRNTAKMGGWSLELQNAPQLGDGSVADETAKAAEKQATGVLYDTREPVGHAEIDMSDPDQILPALEFAYGESAAWVGLDRLVDEILDPDTDPNDARRYYFNVAAPSSDWAFDHARWKDLGGVHYVPEAGSLVVAGFDGARHDDSTALVAVDVESGHAWLYGIWEKPEGVQDWTVDESDVTRTVERLFDEYQVWRLYCDPPYWSETVASWESKFTGTDHRPAVVEFWTNQWKQIGTACRNLANAIRSGEIHYQVDQVDTLGQHVRNAVRSPVSARNEEGQQLWTIRKPAPGRKIDAAMALTIAWEARREAIAAGATKRVKHRSGGF